MYYARASRRIMAGPFQICFLRACNILHRRMTGTSRVQEQPQDDLLLNFKPPEALSVAALPVGEITDRVHSRDDSFFNVC